jgi:hypothetical protein
VLSGTTAPNDKGANDRTANIYLDMITVENELAWSGFKGDTHNI